MRDYITTFTGTLCLENIFWISVLVSLLLILMLLLFTHAINFKRGEFVIMRHNNVRDFEANLLKTTLNDVEVELKLQKTDDEELNDLTGNNARPDIRTRGVRKQVENAFFDIRLTNSNAPSQKHLPVSTILKKYEKEKKRELVIVEL